MSLRCRFTAEVVEDVVQFSLVVLAQFGDIFSLHKLLLLQPIVLWLIV